MPLNPIHLDPDVIEKLSRGVTLVTSTKHLARYIRQQFNLYQRQSGKLVWDSADILTIEAWVHRLWWDINEFHSDQSDPNLSLNTILGTQQSIAIWQEIISADIKSQNLRTAPLWNIAATVNTAINAWKIANEWCIDIDESGKSFSEDHRSFQLWAKQYQHHCKKNHWIDNYQLIDVIIEKFSANEATKGTEICFTGFDTFTTQQQNLIDSLVSNGIDSTIHHPESKNLEPPSCFFEFENQFQQWLGAATWAKGKIEANPAQKIAVVVPDLTTSRELIDHAFSQILCPGWMVAPENNDSRPFRISLGKKLGDFPVIQSAKLLLSLSTAVYIPASQLSKFILSPYVDGANKERYQRNKLEYWCRENLPFQITHSGLLEKLSSGGNTPANPILLKILSDLLEFQKSLPTTQSYVFWVEKLLSCLESFGWPGEQPLNSEEHQTVEAFKNEVAQMRNLDLVSLPVSWVHAVTSLSQRLNEQPFETESRDVPVKVLGMRESLGVHFDAVWMGNLNHNTWPIPLLENPFIPYWLQQQSNYPRTSNSGNFELARIQQRRLINQCDEIVFSRPSYNENTKTLSSSFFEDAKAEKKSIVSFLESCQYQKPQLEYFFDDQGLEIENKTTQGGVGVIEAQASCPFKAYAKFRLGAYDAEPRAPGMSPQERGILLHKILEGIWQKIRSSKSLDNLSSFALKGIVQESIKAHGNTFVGSSGLGDVFVKMQNLWLETLLMQWMKLEIARDQGFCVVEFEKKQQLILGELILNFKIDRVDRLEDGSLMLIDYKSGRSASPVNWFDDRPESPQLPLYALSIIDEKKLDGESEISILSFAQVRNGECAYIGVSKDDSFQSQSDTRLKIRPLEKLNTDAAITDWAELIEHWRHNLITLADEYQNGHAVVDPLDGACQRCDLRGVCRVFENLETQ